jgi:endonuclease YncB( thermonuclease family)
MTQPHYPPFGLHLPCNVVRVIDGDTVEIGLPGSTYQWKLRLIDCWCPEMNTAKGKAAKAAAEELLKEATCSVFIPAPKHITNLLKNLTFDRIPAHLFIGPDMTLNSAMCLAGHATKKKPNMKPASP